MRVEGDTVFDDVGTSDSPTLLTAEKRIDSATATAEYDLSSTALKGISQQVDISAHCQQDYSGDLVEDPFSFVSSGVYTAGISDSTFEASGKNTVACGVASLLDPSPLTTYFREKIPASIGATMTQAIATRDCLWNQDNHGQDLVRTVSKSTVSSNSESSINTSSSDVRKAGNKSSDDPRATVARPLTEPLPQDPIREGLQATESADQTRMSNLKNQEATTATLSSWNLPTDSALEWPVAATQIVEHSLPPLRPLSAYNYFFRYERSRILNDSENEAEPFDFNLRRRLLHDHWYRDRSQKRQHRKTHGKIGFHELSRKISSGWRALSKEEQDFFKEIASTDLARFKHETCLLNPITL